MKPKNKLLILCFSVLIISCEKDNKDDIINTTEINKFNYIIAGNFLADSVVSKSFSPVKEIKGYKKGTTLNYTYLDSIKLDLNNDGINDIKFRYFEKFVENYDCPTSKDSNVIIDCFPDYYQSGEIAPLSNIEIAYNEIKIPEAYIDFIQVHKFVQGDTINNYNLWTKKKIQMIGVMQNSHPFDSWYIDDYLSFVGIRLIEKNDTIYGWIRINTAKNTKFLISDYALIIK